MIFLNSELVVKVEATDTMAAYSPDPWRKVGCIGLNDHGDLLAAGYNHIGDKKNEHLLADRDARRPFMIHAELEMLSHLQKKDQLSTVVVTLLPCAHCMTALAAFNVNTVYYGQMLEKDRQSLEVAKFHGITCVQY